MDVALVAPQINRPGIVVIQGPYRSGKSRIASMIAKRFTNHIIIEQPSEVDLRALEYAANETKWMIILNYVDSVHVPDTVAAVCDWFINTKLDENGQIMYNVGRCDIRYASRYTNWNVLK